MLLQALHYPLGFLPFLDRYDDWIAFCVLLETFSLAKAT